MKNVNTPLARKQRAINAIQGRKRKARKLNAAADIESRRGIAPSARQWFPYLRERLLDSRPIVGHTPERLHADGSRTGGEPIYGKPTFRNRYDRHGRLV